MGFASHGFASQLSRQKWCEHESENSRYGHNVRMPQTPQLSEGRLDTKPEKPQLT